MAEINISPTCYDNFVVGGTGFTEVGGNPVSATVEMKGIDGAYLLPRMTNAQMNALDNADSTVTSGMQVYNTEVQSVMTYIAGSGWVVSASNGFLQRNLILDGADVNGMFDIPFLLLAAPPFNHIISILNCTLSAKIAADWTGGGDIRIQYGDEPAGVLAVSGTIDKEILALDANLSSQLQKELGTYNVTEDSSGLVAEGIYITNDTGMFNGGVGSQLNIQIIYRLIDIGMP